MELSHRFWVHSSVEAVAAFHANPESMAAITPPPIFVRIHKAPDRIEAGEEMDFTLWAGPLPIRWTAQFTDVTSYGFTDRQIRGPFESWTHRHTFRSGARGAWVEDRVRLKIRRHWFWGPIGFCMALGLPALFTFRAWKTRRLLEAGG